MGMKEIWGNEFKSVGDIHRFMEEKVQFWSFSRLLSELYTGQEPLQQRISRKLAEYAPEEKKETVERKVRNWLRDKNLPQSREELFKICFALGLDERKTEQVLGITAENGIHYRNPRELVYALSLRRGEDYLQACHRADALVAGDFFAQNLPDRREGFAYTGYLTDSIKNEFKRIETHAQLEKFLMEHRQEFGRLHNTAYRKFRKMLGHLASPGTAVDLDFPEEKNYGVERVVEEYLRMGVPYDKRSVKYSRISKTVKKHWPSAKSVEEMQSRKRDVDRKTLLLLYLATEGMALGEEETGCCSAKEHYSRINLMMTECGMALLNPHSPFDYLVVQALHTGDEEEFMGLRMERMMRRLFGREKEPAYIAEAPGPQKNHKNAEKEATTENGSSRTSSG